MTAIEFVEDDGGRADAGFKGYAGDCATRAVAIATRLPYSEVYRMLNEAAKIERHSCPRCRVLGRILDHPIAR